MKRIANFHTKIKGLNHEKKLRFEYFLFMEQMSTCLLKRYERMQEDKMVYVGSDWYVYELEGQLCDLIYIWQRFEVPLNKLMAQ